MGLLCIFGKNPYNHHRIWMGNAPTAIPQDLDPVLCDCYVFGKIPYNYHSSWVYWHLTWKCYGIFDSSPYKFHRIQELLHKYGKSMGQYIYPQLNHSPLLCTGVAHMIPSCLYQQLGEGDEGFLLQFQNQPFNLVVFKREILVNMRSLSIFRYCSITQ